MQIGAAIVLTILALVFIGAILKKAWSNRKTVVTPVVARWAGVVTKSHQEADVHVIDEVALDSVSTEVTRDGVQYLLLPIEGKS